MELFNNVPARPLPIFFGATRRGVGGERPANPTVSPHLQEFGWITQLLSLRDSYHSSGTDHF